MVKAKYFKFIIVSVSNEFIGILIEIDVECISVLIFTTIISKGREAQIVYIIK